MNTRKVLSIALVLVAGLLLVSGVLAQTGNGYDLTWWTVDGGGGTVSGSGYTLTGTAGQPEPGPALTGGGYTLYSGFWPGGGEAPPVCEHPLIGVSVGGPSSGETGENLTFTASITSSNATPPITYTWSSDGLVSGQGTANATYRWSQAGDYQITVSAGNCGGLKNDSHTIEIGIKYVYLPLVVRNR